jgi:hypothetical protein
MGNWYLGKSHDPLIDGEHIVLKGQEFVIPRFRLWQHRDASDARGLCVREKWSDSRSVWAARIAMGNVALKANYPEMTEQLIADELEIEDLDVLFEATARAQMRNPKPGEANAPETGQTQPSKPGSDSSSESPAASAGPSNTPNA